MNPKDRLRRYPLFALLTADQLDIWLAEAGELHLAAGETVFQEGTAGHWAYLLLAGRVRALRKSDRGQETSLAVFNPGDLFGEYALLPPHRNTATCRAAAPTRLLRLSLPRLRPLLQKQPDVQANLKNWLRLHTLLQYLHDKSCLGFLSAPSALKYLPHLQSAVFPSLRTIQADGLSSDHWYIVEQGKVLLDSADGRPPRELGQGDCFGERALLDRHGLAVAVAEEEVRCLYLTREAFCGKTDVHSLVYQTYKSVGWHAHPWVGQQEESDCGLATLAMVARSRGLSVTVEQLRQWLAPGPDGVSLMALAGLARRLGLPCQAVRIGPEQWREVVLPAIVRIDGCHFAVIFEYSSEGVVVGDPATGVVTLSPSRIAAQSIWHALLFPPEPAHGDGDKSRVSQLLRREADESNRLAPSK